MKQEMYKISVIGCDDKTVFNIPLDEVGLNLVMEISNKCNETSQYECQPKISIEPLKLYRCGWCGECCDENGINIPWPEDKTGYDQAESVPGECCIYEQWEGSSPEKRQVTRDMATDAGDPSLEGQWI